MRDFCVACHECESAIAIDLTTFDTSKSEHSLHCARCGYHGTYERESVHPYVMPGPLRRVVNTVQDLPAWLKVVISTVTLASVALASVWLAA